MKVKDAMNPEVITVSPGQTLKEVSHVFHENGISGAPVLDSNGMVVGVISDSDVVRAVEPHQETLRLRYPSLSLMSVTFDRDVEERSLDEVCREVQQKPVKEFMTGEVVSLAPDDTIETAVTLMNQSGFNRLPVIEGDQLVGILTRADILRCLTKADLSFLDAVEER